MTSKRREDESVDAMSEDSFPASDPPSTTPPAGTRAAEHTKAAHEGAAEDAGAAGEAKPKGHPTDDRYEAETAAARQSGAEPPERGKDTSKDG
jgi:hypothetical protein